jgi:hypothetical protein
MGMRGAGPAALVLGAALGLAGCVSDQGRVQVLAIGPTPDEMRGVDAERLAIHREVVGRDTRVTSVLFVPTFDGPELDRAVSDALAKGGGEVMVGAHVRTIEYWFLVGWSVLEVRGDVVEGKASEAPR